MHTMNRYPVSFLVNEATVPLPPVDLQVGIDLGLTQAVNLASDEARRNSKFYRHEERLLAQAQRRLANKQNARRTVPKLV